MKGMEINIYEILNAYATEGGREMSWRRGESGNSKICNSGFEE